jgi:hypothetical protein
VSEETRKKQFIIGRIDMNIFVVFGVLLILGNIPFSAHSAVVFGNDGRPFSSEDWSVTGDAVIYSWGISVPSNFSSTNSTEQATVDALGVCDGILIDFEFSGWTSSRRLKILNHEGVAYLELWMAGSGAIRATTFGQDIGEITYDFNDPLRLAVIISTPNPGHNQLTASIENVRLGQTAQLVIQNSPLPPFFGPVTIETTCGYGVGVLVSKVVLLGDQVVATDVVGLGSLKAMFK